MPGVVAPPLAESEVEQEHEDVVVETVLMLKPNVKIVHQEIAQTHVSI